MTEECGSCLIHGVGKYWVSLCAVLQGRRSRLGLGHELMGMEDMLLKFANRFAMTEAENEVIVVDKREALALSPHVCS